MADGHTDTEGMALAGRTITRNSELLVVIAAANRLRAEVAKILDAEMLRPVNATERQARVDLIAASVRFDTLSGLAETTGVAFRDGAVTPA